ncbi:MAG: LPS export ABC transporter permease LptG [Thalassobaculales bacterium]
MRLSWTLFGYVARAFLVKFAGVLAGILCIVLVFDLIELLRRGGGQANVGFGLLIEMALLKLPNMAQIVLPFAVLFAGLLTFSRLTRTNELIVCRAAGVSAWQFLAPAIVCAFLIGAFRVTVFNPVAAVMTARFEQLEDQVLRGRSSLLAVSESGLWLRQGSQGSDSILHAGSLDPRDQVFHDVIGFLFDGEDGFAGRLDAKRARLLPGRWEFEGVELMHRDQTPQKLERYSLPTELTLAHLQDTFAPPETLSFWDLPRFIDILERAGFSAARHRLHLNALLSSPLLLCAMVLIAAAFSMRMVRRGGTMAIAAGGLASGFILYFATDLIYALGLSARLPVVLAAWTPAAVSLLLGVATLLHQEDG